MKPLLLTALASVLTSGCVGGTDPGSDFGGDWPFHTVEASGTVAFRGRTDTRNDSVHVVLVLINLGGDSTRVRHGMCSFAVLAEGPESVSWDNRPPPNTVCFDIGLVVQLRPGEAKELTVLQEPVRSILADSLPAGLYRFSIFYRRRDRRDDLRGIEAGEARLTPLANAHEAVGALRSMSKSLSCAPGEAYERSACFRVVSVITPPLVGRVARQRARVLLKQAV